MKRLALLLLAVAACGDTSSTGVDELNLDRPVDITFACFGGLRITNEQGQPVTVMAQPNKACEIRSQAVKRGDPKPIPPGQEPIPGGDPIADSAWYAFILQSAQGTVQIAQFQTGPSPTFQGGNVSILDSDPLTPGKNGLPVGEEPVAIGMDSTGCFAVTANAGSCDMSLVDVTKALGSDTPPARSGAVTRMQVKNASGEVIDAKPAAMVMQAQTGEIGNRCEAPKGLAYVAYPSCHLVAEVDLATSTIVGGIQYDANGVPTMLTTGNVSCPSECNGGDAIAPGTRPVALDLEVDEDHNRHVLVVGADNSASLTLAELDPGTFRPLSVSQIALENTTGRLGVTNLAISPVIGMGGDADMIDDDNGPGGQFQFVYAVATDGTVRVADILQVRRECDTQVDPRFLYNDKIIRHLSCLPVGDPATPRRRAGARGPGIELTGEAIPLSVDIFAVDSSLISPDHGDDMRDRNLPATLIGYYAVVSSSTGATYIVTIDDDHRRDFVVNTDPLGTQIPLVIAHQLRDAIPDRGIKAEATVEGKQVPICDTNGPDPDAQSGTTAGARVATPPGRNLPSGTIAAEKAFELPSIGQVLCTGNDETKPVSELGFPAPVTVRDLAYPDLRGLRNDETWTLTWEGSLSLDGGGVAIDGPPLREGLMFSEPGSIRLEDQTRPFCDAGVEPYDVVQMRGCDPSLGDADCAVGYRCFVHPNSQIPGLGACMLADEADRLANACKQYLTSIRRYTVGTTTSGELSLLPRKVVLRTTPVDGCVDDNQCKDLANYAQQNVSSSNPVDDMTDPESHTWRCEADPLRKPIGGTGKRCIQVCNTDADCFTGRVCQGGDPNADAAAPKVGTCMEGIVPPQACINAAQRYELRAGEAFTVVGTKSGYVHPIIADASGKCIRDPNASPFQVGRIPLDAPACDPNADPRTGKKPDGTFQPNPCSTTFQQSELEPNYVPGTCNLQSMQTTLASRPAPAIEFRNRGLFLHLVDPTYPGDRMCIGDRQGGLGRVPLVFPGFQLFFRQVAGFQPLTLGIQPSFPVKVVRGPTESIWVIDEGDFLSTTVTAPSTRGKVYRVESAALGAVNLLE